MCPRWLAHRIQPRQEMQEFVKVFFNQIFFIFFCLALICIVFLR